jgi:hypothetical protein
MAAKCFQMPEYASEFREHARTCHKNNRVLAPRPADEVLGDLCDIADLSARDSRIVEQNCRLMAHRLRCMTPVLSCLRRPTLCSRVRVEIWRHRWAGVVHFAF